MLKCYGKPVKELSVYTTKNGIERCLVRFDTNFDRVHNVSSESISWESNNWFSNNILGIKSLKSRKEIN